MNKIRTVVVGASGYIGGEAVRLLLAHPNVELVAVTANENAGKRLDEIQPNLRGFTELSYVKEIPEGADAYVLSLPHGGAMDVIPKLKGRIVDLSGDFRLKDAAVFEKYYKFPHRAPQLLSEVAYGIPEINRPKIREARIVAAGGCFASAAILSLWPLRELADGRAIVDGKTGSSGSGIKPGEKTHHPFRATSFFGYEMFHHRHTPEIEQASGVKVLFQPHSTPLVRGVFTTSYVPLKKELSSDDAVELFRKAYAGERFVRVSKGTTNVNHVKQSNFVDLGVVAEGRTAIVFAAVDNLVKGGAGQGVQCLNVQFGLPDETGLLQAPAQP
jgi:LysW-gamma-L-alpha-aminoadipyl-6-phosphate/LysW-L-glutamyl-5-phosphate reductase